MVSVYSSALRSVSPTASAKRLIVRASPRSRRVAVSASSRWLRTTHANSSVPAGSRPMRPATVARDLDPHDRVVAGAALGDVVQQRGEQQHVAPAAPGHLAVEAGTQRVVRVEQRRALGDGLERVPVDGEAVVGVALRPRPHVLPLGQQSHEQADVVEALEHRDRPAPGGQQRRPARRGQLRPTATSR